MGIKEYIDNHYNEIKDKVTAVTRNHEYTEDLLNDCILNLLEKGHDYLHQLMVDNKVQHYIVKMAYIQFNSSTSPFHLQYRQNTNHRDIETIDIEDKKETVVDVDKLSRDVKLYIGKLPVYERTIAEKHFIEDKSQREMSRMYNINRLHISRDINRIKTNINLKFNKNDYTND